MALAIDNMSAEDTNSLALKAFTRIAEEWQLSQADTAALADMPVSTWKRAKQPGYAGALTQDQLLRLSAVIGIYKALNIYFGSRIAKQWIGLPNKGPLFEGVRPVDRMKEGGLPAFLEVRTYLDALRGGA